jgi:hypothetical protein
VGAGAVCAGVVTGCGCAAEAAAGVGVGTVIGVDCTLGVDEAAFDDQPLWLSRSLSCECQLDELDELPALETCVAALWLFVVTVCVVVVVAAGVFVEAT